jgi:hypothetical protein
VAELSRPIFNLVYFWSGLPAFTQEVQKVMGVFHGQNVIQWISIQLLSLLLNSQFYPLASCPLDK